MKKIFILLLSFLVVYINPINLAARTGHPDVNEIVFKEHGKLLINITDREKKKKYDEIKRCFWGWRYSYMNVYQEANYIGDIIFAKINRTNEPIKIDYSLKETNYIERSVKTVGSISGNFSSKIKKIDGKLQGEFRSDVTKKKTKTIVEDTSFSVISKPNTRLVYRITGDALVTNGVSKYFAFGIILKKGCWEYIDIITTYYELHEEVIK